MMMVMMGKAAGAAAVTLALFLSQHVTPTGALCSNGLEGIQSTSLDVCCTQGCAVCGGPGCTPANTSTLTSGDCCATEIVASGVFCETTGVAPCIITTAAAPANSKCVNGQTGVQDPNTNVCCPLECGQFCGGTGCGSIPGVSGSRCCSSAVLASGRVCSATVEAPCAIVATADGDSTCSNGLPGVEDSVNQVCCDAACGLCGGTGCGQVPGLTALDCCSAEIAAAAQLCSVTGAAPCVLDPPAFAPSTCPNGIPGVQDGSVCCAEACDGTCGGVGCGSIPGTNGASDCCSATILANGVSCGAGVEAPCIMRPGTFPRAPAAAPTDPGVVIPSGTPTGPPVAGSPLVGFTAAPTTAARGGAFSVAPTAGGLTAAPTVAPEAPTPSPAEDTNRDGVVDGNDGVDTNGDGVIDEKDGIDFNGDGVINADDVAPTPIPTSPPTLSTIAPSAAGTAPGARSTGGNGALSTARLPSGAAYAGVLGATVAAVVGFTLLL